MDKDFSKKIYYGYLVKGDLIGAINYVGRFPEQAELYDRFMAVFEREQYAAYEVDAELNGILAIYQRYYRDVFYLGIGREEAEEKLRAGLAAFLGIEDERAELSELEQNQIAEAFRSRGLHFLGGRTSGYYGPYIWRTTENKTYEVELPDGIQTYPVKLLDGFIVKSWIDYLSFGEIGPGGWPDEDGVINCVKASYDFDSENFTVSLLKHEAQHARDLAVDPNMSSENLEYRAKLIELIYSEERNLLERFAQEADGADKSNGHALASSRIVDGFARILGSSCAELGNLPNRQVQTAAKMLFEESSR
ncbi:MAG: hypothetical protein HDT38_06025 [Clostridiales bacterium]|nr:hypothetical protein [Clostridiales bacterium]